MARPLGLTVQEIQHMKGGQDIDTPFTNSDILQITELKPREGKPLAQGHK